MTSDLKKIDVIEILVIRTQEDMARRPQRPSLPQEDPDDDLVSDVTIDGNTDLNDRPIDYSSPGQPQPPKEYVYIRHEIEPEPVNRYGAIIRNVEYPPIAIDMGISGMVIVCAYIDKNGDVTECWVENGVPNTGLNEAVIEAVRKTKFKPAIQQKIARLAFICLFR